MAGTMIFTDSELLLIQWMLDTATENNPDDAELAALDYKIKDLQAQRAQEVTR